MTKTERKSIDGIDVEVTQLTAMKSLRMFHRLATAVGPAFGELMGALGGRKNALDAELDPRALGLAVSKLCMSVSADDLESITRELLETARVHINGQQGRLMDQFELLFQGKLPTLFKVLAFALQVNYGSFSVALPALAAAASKASDSAASTI